MQGELAGFLSELGPGRDGREAFAALAERTSAIRPDEAAPWLVDQLYSLMAAPDNGNRPLLVRLVATVAWSRRHLWKPERSPALEDALGAGVPVLAGFLADADPSVRRVVPYAICEIVTGESGVGGLLRDRTGVEDDSLALAGQVRALDELGHASGAGSTPRSWPV